MDYEKKYKQLHTFISDLYPFMSEYCKEKVEGFFPELKEGEDEMVRKELMEISNTAIKRQGTTLFGKSYDYQKWIAWLEKQGEKHTPTKEMIFNVWDLSKIWKELTKGYPNTEYGTEVEYIQKHWEEGGYYTESFEKQGEQKSDDKVEPKFKVGNWVVYEAEAWREVLQIETIDEHYTFTNGSSSSFDEEQYMRLWTIEDAKDGDVLVIESGRRNNECLFIFKDIADREVLEYCYYRTIDNTFSPSGSFIGYLDNVYHPATKEQREQFEKAMKEAGYKWDAKKKELKKIEPKFKVGDWIVYNDANVYQVKEIDYTNIITCYELENIDGDKLSIPFTSDYNLRNWTIEDAKDGDVLANNAGAIFINADIDSDKGRVTLDCYCYLSVQNEFCIERAKTGSWFYKNEIKPATKEQCDLLFSKMHEAGYEWDAENKELKKIEKNFDDLPKSDDYVIEGLEHAKTILEKTLGKVEGYQSDDGILEHKCAISALKQLAEQKPTWSKEDEKYTNELIQRLHHFTMILKTLLWHNTLTKSL